MAPEDSTWTAAALRALRRRWLAPSPPLAVDDEPDWRPAADPGTEVSGHDGTDDRPLPEPATS